MPFLRSQMPFKSSSVSSVEVFLPTLFKSIYGPNKKVLAPYGVNTVQHKDLKSWFFPAYYGDVAYGQGQTRLAHARFIYIVFQIIPHYKISVNNCLQFYKSICCAYILYIRFILGSWNITF